MKHRLPLIAVLLLMLASIPAVSQTNLYDSIFVDGRWRTFYQHLPTGFNAAKRYPLVLAFHGGAPMGYQSIQFQSGLTEKADAEGFILVYPEGYRIAGVYTFNAGACCAPATTMNIDDVGYVDALLNTLRARLPIDTTRVYATGFSNGALLCYRLANQLTHRFAAIAPVAGCLVYYPWTPTRALPIISFHSYKDQNVKYSGGVTVGSTDTYFPPQDSILGVISANYSCSKQKDTISHQVNAYDHFVYSDCSCGAVIEQYVSYDGEHSWPGGKARGTTTVSAQFNATDLMWQFFQRYTTACQTTSVPTLSSIESPLAFPNPFHGRIAVRYSTGPEPTSLFNSVGELIWSGSDIEQQDFAPLPAGLYLVLVRGQLQMLVKE
ncbi:MAG: hypothetical protein RIR53_224 [Bacteroidota bacterium]|jgi:polyhydroxybutyrate depolymerase